MPDTIAYTPATPSNAECEALNATTHRGGAKFPSRTASDTTAESKLAQMLREMWLTHERLWAFLMPLRAEWVSGLNIAVNPGVYRKADGTDVTFAGSASYAIADNRTDRKVYIDTATNTLAQADAWPADKTAYVPICEVTTAGGTVVSQSIKDRSNYVRMQVHATSTSPTGSNATAFTIDDDNAGAGVDCDLRFNRGASDAEDAALRWVAAGAIFRLLAQHATGTRAGLDLARLQVAGSDVIDTAGTLVAAALAASRLYTFGANGATPCGLRLTPAGTSGAPTGGTHAAGELHVDAAGALYVCTAAGTPGTWARVADQLASPAAGVITTASLEDALADKLVQISIPDASGASPRTVSIQAKDRQGNNLAEVVYLEVRVCQDADGAATATNATIAVGSTGALVRTVTAGKVLVCRTSSGGQLDITVTDGTSETVYLLAAPAPRSRMLDCSDIGTVTIS